MPAPTQPGKWRSVVPMLARFLTGETFDNALADDYLRAELT